MCGDHLAVDLDQTSDEFGEFSAGDFTWQSSEMTVIRDLLQSIRPHRRDRRGRLLDGAVERIGHEFDDGSLRDRIVAQRQNSRMFLMISEHIVNEGQRLEDTANEGGVDRLIVVQEVFELDECRSRISGSGCTNRG